MASNRKNSVSDWMRDWKVWLSAIALLGTTTGYLSGFFGWIGTTVSNINTLVEVADTYNDKVDSVRIGFEDLWQAHQEDSVALLMLRQMFKDTIREREQKARRFARISTDILLGGMTPITHHGYNIWATPKQIDPDTRRVYQGYYIYQDEPHEASFDANKGDYYIRLKGRKIYCNEVD